LHGGAQHVAFDDLKRLGLCIIKLFAAQYPTPHDRCVRFAAVVAGDHATLARGRLATALPSPDIHRLESASFAWRTENPGFLDYRCPVASDLPMIEAVLIEVPNPRHPFGARVVGEVPIVPPMAAIANAIRSASGLRMPDLPITPPKLRAALDAAGSAPEVIVSC
jgi:hypothetical protein